MLYRFICDVVASPLNMRVIVGLASPKDDRNKLVSIKLDEDKLFKIANREETGDGGKSSAVETRHQSSVYLNVSYISSAEYTKVLPRGTDELKRRFLPQDLDSG